MHTLRYSFSDSRLPADYHRSEVIRVKSTSYQFNLPESISEELISLSNQEDIPLFVVLLSAFKVLIHRYTNQSIIMVGSPGINGEADNTGIPNEIFRGFIEHTTDFSNNPTFLNVLKCVKSEIDTSLKTDNDSMREIQEVDQTNIPRDYSSEIPVEFMMNNFDHGSKDISSDVLQSMMDKANQREIFDLALVINVFMHSLEGILIYNQELFEQSTIERMSEHFISILKSVVTQPDSKIGSIQLLTPIERNQLLVQWNNTNSEHRIKSTVIDLFEDQVLKTPDSIALIEGSKKLTYRELNQKSNQLAHYLISQGIKPEVPVGICIDRSSDMVIGLLGILKAGGAYLPLDPTYPSNRLNFMIDDASPALIITQSNLENKFPKNVIKVFSIDSKLDNLESQSTDNPININSVDNLAYIIYTSGSTGIPKGVMIEHRSLANFTIQATEEYEIIAGDRILQFASISFDASAEEIYPCLTSGATLVLRTDDMLGSSEAFFEFCNEMDLTVVDLPTSYWRQLVGELSTVNSVFPNQLRLVIIGGEKAEAHTVAQWFNIAPQSVRLVNTYGPTEATVVATVFHLTNATDLSRVPIGKPIGNVKAYILDRYLEPLPVGLPGELHLGGIGLARGYLNRPELTSDKFISKSFSSHSHERLYKTGDLVRYLPDGNIEFIGRIDNQVKIRGFRIELGEIEAAFRKHPAVKDITVIAREDSPGEKKLVAYIVERQEKDSNDIDWRNYLRDKLPKYMIPSAFVILENFPISPSGKVDHKSLPEPQYNRTSLDQTFVAPSTNIEEELVNIWSQVFKQEHIGVHDNFFDFGGDSIISIQITSRANQAGIRLAPNQVLEKQTIAKLAEVAETGPTFQADQDLITGSFSLNPYQLRYFELVNLDLEQINHVLTLELKHKLDKSLLEETIKQLLIHHDALRLRFYQEQSDWCQDIYYPQDIVPISYVNLSELPKKARKNALQSIILELQTSLNLSKGSLIKFVFIDLGPNAESYLSLIIHPLISDSYSWGILLDQFELAYQQLSDDGDIKLPDKTVSFTNWSHRLSSYASSDKIQDEVSFWTMRQNMQVAPLPQDYLNGREQIAGPSTSSIRLNLSTEDTNSLLKDVPKAYRTLITDVLLTALVVTFNKWTGNPNLLIDILGQSRQVLFDEIDLSQTIGCFSVIYPAILGSAEISGIGGKLVAVKEQLRSIPNEGIGYGLLRYLNKDDDLREKIESQPQAQLCFQYLGQFDNLLRSSTIFNSRNIIYIPPRIPGGDHQYLIEISAITIADQLHLYWTYSKGAYQQKSIERLAQETMETLQEIIEHCQAIKTARYTPSDFPEADLTQQELDALLAEISELED